jgi:hypothetical protein
VLSLSAFGPRYYAVGLQPSRPARGSGAVGYTWGLVRPPDAVLVSALTVTAYLTTFAYEVGAAQAFGIPIELIDLQLMPTLLATIFSLSVLVVVFIVAADPLFAVLSPPTPDSSPVLMAIRPPFAMLVLTLALWLVGDSTVRRLLLWSTLPALVIFGVLPVVMPLLLYRDVPGYVEKLRASYRAEGIRQSSLNRVLLGSLGWITHLSVLTITLMVLSLNAGYAKAKRQEIFFVTNQQPETVVLRIYGDRVITAEFVRKEKRVKRLYQVLRVDVSGLVLRQESVGPLSLDD